MLRKENSCSDAINNRQDNTHFLLKQRSEIVSFSSYLRSFFTVKARSQQDRRTNRQKMLHEAPADKVLYAIW
jgi:hypothetical protein